ncbi:MAG: LysR family transcriptional regulator [Rhodanobacter sp.]
MDIRRADLPLLISLDALLEDLNVTRAAKRLNISQSTLSGQLARLRDLFANPLLMPAENGRGMVATEYASALQPRLHRALLELHGAVAAGAHFDPATSQRTFVVAINDNAFSIVGLPVAQIILNQCGSGLRASYVAPDMAVLSGRMERGEVDLYVGAARTLPKTLKQRPLVTDAFRMAQRKGHPRGTAPLDLAVYCSLRHVLVSPDGGFASPIDERLAELGVERRVVLTVPGYNQVALLLTVADGVATLPSRLLKRYADQLDVFDLPFEYPHFVLSMAWHPRAQDDPAHRWLREQFMAAVE